MAHLKNPSPYEHRYIRELVSGIVSQDFPCECGRGEIERESGNCCQDSVDDWNLESSHMHNTQRFYYIL